MPFSGGSTAALADVLEAQRTAILEAWEQAVRQLPSARGLPRPVLVDSMPRLFDRIVAAMRHADETGALEVAREQADERVDAGFDVGEAVLEYALLREAILRLADVRAAASPILHRAIDDAIAARVARFTAVQKGEAERHAAELFAIVESIPDGVFIADRRCVRVANHRGLALLGVPSLAALQHGHDALLAELRIRDPATGAPVRLGDTALSRAFAGEASFRELALTRPDGADIVVRMAAAPIEIEGRIDRVVFVMSDVTDSRRAEEAQRFLSDATSVLASSLESEETLERVTRLAVPRLGDWCTVDLVSPEGAIRNVAVAHVDPAKIALAKQLAERYPRSMEDAVGIAAVVRSGRSELGAEITDELLVRAARDEEHLRILRELGLRSYVIVPLSARGRVFGTLSLVSSEPGRRYGRAELEIIEHLGRRAGLAIDNARLYREAQEAARQREQVLAVVSHDLRNPLGAVQMAGAMMLARAHELGDARLTRHVEIVQRNASRMGTLIDDLLDMATVQAGRLAVDVKPETAASLVDEALTMQAPLASEKGVALAVDCHVGAEQVLCDRARVDQVFANLVGNAIKFCRRGDEVTVRAARRDGEVLFAVADTGPGIPAESLGHIFDPYWTSARDGSQGTGLGLFIANGIVHAHGGRMWAESVPGSGATFYFTLPVAA